MSANRPKVSRTELPHEPLESVIGKEDVVGHVRVWKPSVHLVMTWEVDATWKSDARIAIASEIDVRFEADAAGGTRVELAHRNFERMGRVEGETMRKAVDNGWPELLRLFVAAATTEV